jgi:Cu/Ag efflux protein CusF
MKTLILILVLTVATTNGITHAATQEHDMPQHEMAMPHVASQTRHEGTGLIKDVNAKSGKVLLAHEPIPSLHWPAMTMWFELQGALPSGVKIGDPVRFELEQTHSKAWVITLIEPKN